MKAINDFPGGLTKPWDEVENDLQNLTEIYTGPGSHWTLFQHKKHTDDVWFIWCNEGYGMMLYDYELEAFARLVESADIQRTLEGLQR